MLKKYFTLFLGFLVLLLGSSFTYAANVVPAGGLSGWDLYVMGNGTVIATILNSISLMMGSTGYRTLILFMASLGTVALAIMSGYDAGKNGMKFLIYFLTVYITMYATTRLNSDVLVIDTAMGTQTPVQDVPAVVAVPASVISQVGHWLTKKVEATFSLPGEFMISEGGYFNLPGTILADSAKITITDPNLKGSITSYTTDCLIAGMASGAIQGKDLLKSTNLWQDLKFDHPGVMTVYYSLDGTSSSNGTSGQIVSCSEAYANITADLEARSSELLTANAGAWETTGGLPSLETAISSSAAWMTSGGSLGTIGTVSPAGFVQQRAVINALKGTFRNAATQTGNNEMITALAVSQAEQSQKSSWQTGAEIFNHMMGYVYTVLQAFIFAVIPIILVAALIPGFGKTLITNYGQILIWLTLWEPMLAIVNFLILSFGHQQITAAVGAGTEGMTLANAGTITEAASNTVIAAQFLGTMVPMVAWGLVKGSMAFTEFISHGMGNSFAQSAGGMAATGNVSLNTQSMNNQSMNSHNFADSYSGGYKDSMAHLNPGAGAPTNNLGGSGMGTTTLHGGSAGENLNWAKGATSGTSVGHDSKVGLSAGTGRDSSESVQSGHQQGLTNNASISNSKGNTSSDNKGVTSQDSAGTSTTNNNQFGNTQSATMQQSQEASHGLKPDLSLPSGSKGGGNAGGGPGAGVAGPAGGALPAGGAKAPKTKLEAAGGMLNRAGANVGINQSESNQASMQANHSVNTANQNTAGHTVSASQGASVSKSSGVSGSTGTSASEGISSSEGSSASESHKSGADASSGISASSSVGTQLSSGQQMSVAAGSDLGTAQAVYNAAGISDVDNGVFWGAASPSVSNMSMESFPSFEGNVAAYQQTNANNMSSLSLMGQESSAAWSKAHNAHDAIDSKEDRGFSGVSSQVSHIGGPNMGLMSSLSNELGGMRGATGKEASGMVKTATDNIATFGNAADSLKDGIKTFDNQAQMSNLGGMRVVDSKNDDYAMMGVAGSMLMGAGDLVGSFRSFGPATTGGIAAGAGATEAGAGTAAAGFGLGTMLAGTAAVASVSTAIYAAYDFSQGGSGANWISNSVNSFESGRAFSEGVGNVVGTTVDAFTKTGYSNP